MKHFCSFSEAIREGAKLGPQGKGVYFNEITGATCAFGAGLAAVFGPKQYETDKCVLLYPYLDDTGTACPACGVHVASSLASVIFHLNDDHLWTREAIADWLEAEEEKIGFVTLTEGERSESSSLQTVHV